MVTFVNESRSINSKTTRDLHDAKKLEWIFIGIRFTFIIIASLISLWHRNTFLAVYFPITLGYANIVACLFNWKIKSQYNQALLAVIMFSIDIVATWCLMLLYVREFYIDLTAYAGYAFIIIEAALRFGLFKSLITGIVFTLSLWGVWLYRGYSFNIHFNDSGYITWIIIVLITVILAGIAVYEERRQQRKTELLAKEKSLLFERQRISNELHDSVLKSLHGIALEAHVLTQIDSKPVKDRAKYIEEVCNQVSNDTRDVILDLRNSRNESINLELSRIIEFWSSQSGIKTSFNFIGNPLILPYKITHNLCRVLSESLNNIEKHADATNVQINCTIDKNNMAMDIIDNGHGFGKGIIDPSSFIKDGKLGLVGMKERIESIGGKLIIETGSDGTIIKTIVPLALNG